jgi:NAD-dependent dihydropyrimidine dehydrogenase PreA subunit
VVDAKECHFCLACVDRCSTGAIVVEECWAPPKPEAE